MKSTLMNICVWNNGDVTLEFLFSESGNTLTITSKHFSTEIEALTLDAKRVETRNEYTIFHIFTQNQVI